MTIVNWRNVFVKICKSCPHFYDRGRNRYRYRCEKFGCSIYETYGCKNLHAAMEEARKISLEAQLKAFNNLVNVGKEEKK
jgi:hypothetical protein